ncbi:MAG: Ig-like domain-containing protein, partial [Anaerolineaceae bacterium]|nr:Ig-like domain-containing protein [Anaerolineaceae bacterium]
KDEIDDIISVETSTIPASSNFTTLYDQAIAEGFELKEAYKNFFEGGKVTYLVTMRTPDKGTARFISLDENGYATASTTDGSSYFSIQDVSGGQSTNLLTLESTLWGSWESPESVNSIMVECNYARCMRNCSMKKIAVEMMKDAAKGAAVWLLGIPVFGGIAVTAWAVYETADMAHEIYLCHEGCETNPLTGCCNAGEILWSPSTLMGNTSCSKYVCSESSLSFPPTPNSTDPCGYGSRCVAGNGSQGGCKPCTEDYKLSVGMIGPERLVDSGCQSATINGGQTKCSDMTIKFAKDPNAIYGPLGDVLPEQVMDYRITCENEGEGNAYGVYIVNDLPEQLDEDNLVINDGGIYLSAERQIIWLIGELGPKGDPSSEAEVSYSAQLKPGLEIGTAVINQATVYFPSVPEETPTNIWTNLVYPLAATPMPELETDYMTPLAITLEGRPAGSLTFNLESLPLGGTLEGELPNLTYTPVENFSGTDFFTFSVSLDGETSQPAQVTIKVSSSGDTTKPTVLWSVPENGEMDVATGSTPVYTSPAGEVFSPILAAKFSEKLKEESITSDSVVVKDPGGTVVPSSSVFDPANNQLAIQLLTALGSETTYTVTLSNTIKDLAGNALTAYAWEFTTEAGESAGGQIFLPMITR